MWCSDEPAPFGRLVASEQYPDDHVELVPADDALDGELAGQLAEAFEDIALIYEDALDRRPRPKELLGVVGFLLSATPSDYVDVPAGTSGLEITAENGDGDRRTG